MRPSAEVPLLDLHAGAVPALAFDLDDPDWPVIAVNDAFWELSGNPASIVDTLSDQSSGCRSWAASCASGSKRACGAEREGAFRFCAAMPMVASFPAR